MTAVGLIGCGGIAQDVVAALRRPKTACGSSARWRVPAAPMQARAALGGIDIVEALDELLARRPAVVAEVAGQQAVAEHGEPVLRGGIDCLVISVGALADPALLGAAQGGGAGRQQPHPAAGGRDRRHRRDRRDAGRGPHLGALPLAQAAGRLARLAGREGRRSRHAHAAHRALPGHRRRGGAALSAERQCRGRGGARRARLRRHRGRAGRRSRRARQRARDRSRGRRRALCHPAARQAVAQQSEDLGARRP